MTTNRIIAAIVIITILLMALFGWYVVSSNSTSGTPISNVKKTLQNFFPFGNPDTSSNTETPTTTAATSSTGFSIDETGSGEAAALPRLRQVSTEPIAGASIFSIPIVKSTRSTSTSTVATTSDYIVYIEQGTGHVFKELVDSPTQQLLSATTIPKVDTAFVGQNNAVAYQYYKNDNETLETFLGNIVADPAAASTTAAGGIPATGKVAGSFLPQDIYRFDVAPTGDRIFYLTQNVDSDTGYLANIDGSKSTQVFSSPLRELNISWPKVDTMLINTSPDSSVPGYLFSLNLSTKKFSQLLGGIAGLTAIGNPDLSYLIYNESTYNSFVTHIYRVKDGLDRTIKMTTLPEKCTWSSVNNDIAYCAVPSTIPAAGYPESWYKGDVTFSDNLWRFNLDAGTSTEVLVASQEFPNGQSADMTDLSVDQGDHYLIFKNKTDNTLWEYHLDETVNNIQ